MLFNKPDDNAFTRVRDPRTNLEQTLSAVLIAELIGNESWENLIHPADRIGFHKEADLFRSKLKQKKEHLEKVRTCYSESLTGSRAGT